MTQKISITTKLPDTERLSEIYQSTKLKQALLKKRSATSYERITPFVLCRDFLVDVYTFSKAKRHFSIYGMEFDGTKNSPDETGIYILLQFPSAEVQKTFESNLPMLQDVEQANKIPVCKYLNVEPLLSVVDADNAWAQSCLSFSLFSFLLRVICNPFSLKLDLLQNLLKFDDKQNTDSRYVQSLKPETWKRILQDVSLLFTSDFCGFNAKTDNTATIHHNSGFISVFGYHTEQSSAAVRSNKHWKYMVDKGLKTYVEPK